MQFSKKTLLVTITVTSFMCVVVLFKNNFSSKHFPIDIRDSGMQQQPQKIDNSTVDIHKIKKPFLSIPEEDISKYLVPYNYDQHHNNTCPLNILHGAPPIPYNYINHTEDTDWPKFSALYAEMLTISAGGEWQPNDCIPRFLVAILIPVQNRESNLRELLLYMHPFLQRQNIHYKIYVIELAANITWNKGILFNIGFIEAMKDRPFPCLILHDVDSLPKYRNNIYACSTGPRLMCVIREPWTQKYYDTFFGAAVAILSDHYKLVNGYSNNFILWGGEDDNFHERVERMELQIMQFADSVSVYRQLRHKQTKINDRKWQILEKEQHMFGHGLNTTQYNVISRLKESLCTRIIVSIE